MESRRKGKPIPKKATTFKQRQLNNIADDEWAVHTTDVIILAKIYDQMELGEGSSIVGSFSWRHRRVPVLFITFAVAEYLKNNKHNFPNYALFHRKPRAISHPNEKASGLWHAWNEGEKKISNFLKEAFRNFKRC